MKNVIKFLFLFFTISTSSCQKCNDCDSLSEIINDLDGDGIISNSDMDWATTYAKQLGYDNWVDYIKTNYPNEEFCGAELRDAKRWELENDLDGDGVNDYRVYYQCTSQGNGPILCFFC